MLRRNLLIYGLGGHHRAVRRHQAHRPRHHLRSECQVMRRQLLPALGMLLVFTVLTGVLIRCW